MLPQPTVLPLATNYVLPAAIPVWFTTVLFDLQVTVPSLVPVPWPFGEISFESQCQFDDRDQLTSVVVTITVSPDPFWEDWPGSPFTYTWSASSGSITGSGLTAIWTRPIENGFPVEGEATLTISDGTGGSFGSPDGFGRSDQCD